MNIYHLLTLIYIALDFITKTIGNTRDSLVTMARYYGVHFHIYNAHVYLLYIAVLWNGTLYVLAICRLWYTNDDWPPSILSSHQNKTGGFSFVIYFGHFFVCLFGLKCSHFDNIYFSAVDFIFLQSVKKKPYHISHAEMKNKWFCFWTKMLSIYLVFFFYILSDFYVIFRVWLCYQ